MSAFIKTLPALWYYDPDIFQLERKAIFGCEWLYAGEEKDLRRVGDFIAFELAGYPIFLVVGADEKLRAFHNVCRHRAAPLLAEKKGQLKSNAVTCPYHRWTYDLAGNLVQAALCDSKSLTKDCLVALFEIQVGVLHDLVFINLDLNAPSFAKLCRPIRAEIDKAQFAMIDYTSSTCISSEGEFNWKVWMDGYQECYHCMSVHPILQKDFALLKYHIDNKDGYSVHSCERKSSSHMGGFGGLWLWLYPNLGLPCYEPCFYTLQVNPLSAARTQLNYCFRFKASVTDETRETFIRSIEEITREDIAVCEQVQRNLRAGIFSEGFLSPERENGVVYFQSLVRKALQQYR